METNMNDFDKLTAALGTIPWRIDNSGVMVIGEKFTGYVDLSSLTALPETHPVTFANGGEVDLSSLTALPEAHPVTFSNRGNVYLNSLTALPETHRVAFNNGGYVYLNNLTALPESHPVAFNNGGTVFLGSLTALHELHRVAFNNGGEVDLGSLTTLPKTHSVMFSNGGTVNLDSLTQENQHYGGKSVRLRHIDGHTMLMGRLREQGDVTIHSARYFGGGQIDKLRKCFIAEQDEYTAHGKTIASAVSDLRFKIAQVDFNADDLVATIIERGTVLRDDFRLITGACDEGLTYGLVQSGLPGDAIELPLDTVMAALHGPYGDAFRDAMAK